MTKQSDPTEPPPGETWTTLKRVFGDDVKIGADGKPVETGIGCPPHNVNQTVKDESGKALLEKIEQLAHEALEKDQ